MKKSHNLFLVMLFLEILISQIALIPLVSAQEGEVTLSPTDDTFVDDITAVGNFGNWNILEVGKYEDPYVGPVEFIVWLKFNPTNQPTNDGPRVRATNFSFQKRYTRLSIYLRYRVDITGIG